MLLPQIIRTFGAFLYLFSGVLLIPLFVAAYFEFFVPIEDHPQLHSTISFAVTFLICWGLAFLCERTSRKEDSPLNRHEALASVVFIWFLTPLIAALPFLFSGTLERVDQAYFEMVSGFTTTGATIMDGKKYDSAGKEIPIIKTYSGLSETTYKYYGSIKPVNDPKTDGMLEGIEAVGSALLFWRSLSQWLGGIGIAVIFVALLPTLGIGSKALFQIEASGVLKEGLTPRIKDTAVRLVMIYIILTLLQIVTLKLTNSSLGLFDIFTLSFTTISVGGFSIHNENIAFYQNASIEWVVIAFMVLGSLNYGNYYYIFKGKFFRLFESEFLVYISLLAVFGAFASWQLIGWEKISLTGVHQGYYGVAEAIRTGFFQAISFQSSAGFYTANYDAWPASLQMILIFVTFLGGMAGSAAGGMKIIRVYILYKIAKNKIVTTFKPDTVTTIQIGSREIESGTITSVLCFFLTLVIISVVATIVFILDGIDVDTAFSLTAALVNNAGMGLRAAGATGTEAFLNPFSSWLSSLLMIMGRLELYAVLILLLPDFWRMRT